MKKLILFTVALLLAGCVQQIETTTTSTTLSESVTISTDKTEYVQGESIKILVKNQMDRPIYYSDYGDWFWSLEYLEDNKWVRLDGFQLTKAEVGDTCYIVLFERPLPSELKSGANLSVEWNQRICPFGGNWTSQSRYVESGSYRLVFSYGLKISEDDPFEYEETLTIYSNTFTIK